MKILTGSIHQPIIFRMADKGDTPSATMKAPVKGTALSQSILPPKETVVADGVEVEIDARLPGEKEPDFSGLGDGVDDDPEKEEKGQETPPDAKKQAPEKKEPEEKKPEVEKKPETRKQEEPPEMQTAEEIEAERVKKEAEVKKPEPEKKETQGIPADDTDLDAMQLKPGTSPKIQSEFAKAKEQTKLARAEARKLAQEKATVEQTKAELEQKLATVKPIDEATEKELQRLKTFETHTLLENDPQLVKEFKEKMDQADERLIALLIDNGFSDEDAKKMREMGIDKFNGAWWKKEVLDKLDGDPLTQQQILDAIITRGRIKEEKKLRVAAITKDAEALTKQKDEQFKKQWEDFGNKAKNKAIELQKTLDDKWATPIQISPTMTPEARAAADAHNVKAEAHAKVFLDKVNQTLAQNPEVISEVVYKSIRHDVLLDEIKAFKTEKANLETRIAELESDIAATQRTGRIGDRGSAPPKEQKKGPQPPKLGQTADEAFEEWENEKSKS